MMTKRGSGLRTSDSVSASSHESERRSAFGAPAPRGCAGVTSPSSAPCASRKASRTRPQRHPAGNGRRRPRPPSRFRPFCLVARSAACLLAATLVLQLGAGVAQAETQAPAFASATINAFILTVTFDEALAPGAAVAEGSAFTVTAKSWNGTRAIAGLGTAAAEGAAVTVRLTGAALHGETLTVAYTPPEEGPVRDLAGNEAAAFSGEAATNLTPVIDHGAPRLLLTDAAVKGAKLTLAYNYHLHPYSLTKHAARNFEVTVNGNVVDLAASRPVSVSTSKVVLTLAEAVSAGDTVTLSYTQDWWSAIHTVSYGHGYGYLYAQDFTDLAVPNITGDVTAPTLSAVVVDRAELTLTFDEQLDPDAEPAASAFSVTVNGKAVGVRAWSLTTNGRPNPPLEDPVPSIIGRSVLLSLQSPVGYGAAVAVAYEPPGSGAKLRDLAGNAVAGFAYTRADNRTEAPYLDFLSASANGSRLTVTFNKLLDENSVPAGNTFKVKAVPAEGAARSISGTGATSVYGKTVSVSLAEAVVHGEVLTVDHGPADSSAFRPPRPITTPGVWVIRWHSAIRDLSGSRMAPFSGKAATNNTPDTPPTLESASVDGSTLTLTFDEALDTSDSAPAASAFSVAGTAAATSVTSVSFHGTDATKVELTLNPAVEYGESGLTVDYAKPEANPLADASANEVDDFTTQPVTNDTPAPTQVALVSDPGADATYAAGDRIEVRIIFDEAVAVDTEAGAPRLRLDLDPADGEDSSRRWAAYDGGTGTKELTFAWVVQSGDTSTGGVAVLADTLELNGGTIKSVATQEDAALGHAGLAHDPAHKVDTAAPQLLRGEVDGGTMRLFFSEALDPGATGGRFMVDLSTAGFVFALDATGAVSIEGAVVTVGLGGNRRAEVGRLTGNQVLYIRRADGAGGALRDLAGNLVVAPDVLPIGDGVEWRYVRMALVNVTGPAATVVVVVSDAGADKTYGLGDTIRVRVDFVDPVEVTGTPRLKIDMDPAHWGEKWASYESGSGTSSLTFAHTVVEPNYSTQGIAVLANSLETGGGTIRTGGADADLAHDGRPHDANHKVDWQTQPESGGDAPGDLNGDSGLPTVTGVSVVSSPGSGDTYLYGETIRVRVAFDRAVAVIGSPRLKIDMDPAHWGEKWASYESGSDTSSLTFAHTVVEPNYSTQGIAVLANTLQLNGGTIRSVGSTNAALGHTGLGHDSGHKVDWRPDISVADAQANEGAGASVAFVVSLSRVFTGSEHRVTVDYATSNGTAMAGADYTATSGTLTFGARERTKTVSVPVLDDSHDEREETFTLRLSNATGARIGDGEATGTIVNADPMPRAWLARFGRTVAEQVVHGVQARLEARHGGGAHARIAGQELAAGDLDADEAARLADQALARWLAGTPEQPRTMTGGELLARSTFAVTATAAEGAPSAALWGRGGWSRFDGREESLSVDGEVTSALLGAEVASGAWLGGVMLSHARGDGSYRSDADAGTVASALTAVHPYVGVDLNERLTAWAAGGLGLGGLTLTPEGAAALETDLTLVLAASGARGRLVEPAAGSGFSLAIETDAYWVRTSSAAAVGLAETQADATRIRLGLDGGYRFALGGAGALEPTVEIGVRHDGGHAETGYGMDLGGGLAWSAPALGLSAQVAARGLLTAAFDGFREVGASGSLAWDPDPASDRGPSLTATQTVGAAASGGSLALFGRPTLAGLTATADGLDSHRLDLRAGYGFATAGDRFTMTPEFGLGLSETGRDYTLGWRLTQRAPASFAVGIAATRRESAHDRAEHDLGLTMTASW